MPANLSPSAANLSPSAATSNQPKLSPRARLRRRIAKLTRRAHRLYADCMVYRLGLGAWHRADSALIMADVELATGQLRRARKQIARAIVAMDRIDSDLSMVR
jgi:hypothetical protein